MIEKEIREMAEADIVFYEQSAENSGKLARLSLAGSYVSFLAGPVIVASEQTPDSFLAGSMAVGCGFLLKELKDRCRSRQDYCEEEAATHQELLDSLTPED